MSCGMETRGLVMGASVVASFSYGQSISGRPKRSILVSARHRALPGTVFNTCWRLRCPELGTTLFIKGHLVDPCQALDYSCLRQARRIMTKDSQLRCRAKRVHDKVKQGGVRVRGPVSQLFEVAESLGWSWDDFEKFKRTNESDLPLCSSAPTAGEVSTCS